MIAVIADDLTGAAEIGGVGLNYGLRVEILNDVNTASTADLLIINTDSRSKTEKEAIALVTEVCRQLKVLNPDWIYKKIDSVMRGHVLAEIEVEMEVFGQSKVIIVPANPHLGRTLVNEVYLINGTPIHQSSFASDPEFPIRSAQVKDMLRAQNQELAVKKHHEVQPQKGIIVGEVSAAEDLTAWAALAKHNDLLAGAASFFTALLSRKFKVPQYQKTGIAFSKPALYVSGTTFGTNAAKIKSLFDAGGPVCYMPQSIIDAKAASLIAVEKWSREVSTLLAKNTNAVIAIDQEYTSNGKGSAVILRENMALAVEQIFKQLSVEELIIEGGSTAAAILSKLNIRTLFPVQEIAHGVIRCRAVYNQNIHVTLKPGSYPWSEKLWNF